MDFRIDQGDGQSNRLEYDRLFPSRVLCPKLPLLRSKDNKGTYHHCFSESLYHDKVYPDIPRVRHYKGGMG